MLPAHALFASVLIAAIAAQDPQVIGRAVDGAGKPVADVEVHTSWSISVPRHEPMGGAVTSDADGRFTIPGARRDMPYAVLGFTRNRDEGFAVVVEPGVTTVECRLQPTVDWSARLRCPDLGLSKVGTTVFVRDANDRVNLGFLLDPDGGDLHMVLPAGDCLLCTNGDDLARLRLPLHLDAAHREVRTNVDVPAAAWAKQIGQPLPDWHVTAVRNAAPSLRIADHRGRWLVIAFLEERLLTCWDDTMPKLAALHADPALASKLAFVAIVARGPADFAAFDASYAKRQARTGWPDLPAIPLLLDGDGATEKLLGVDRHPLMLLVDPHGKLWGCVDRWNRSDVAVIRAAATGALPARTPPVLRGLGERSEAEAKDDDWNALPSHEHLSALDQPTTTADELVRNRRCNPTDTYLAPERRAALQAMLSAEQPNLIRLKQAYEMATSQALNAAIQSGRILPAHEGMLTDAEKATLERRAGQDAGKRAEWVDRLLSARVPRLRRITSNAAGEGKVNHTYLVSLADLPEAKPARDAFLAAQHQLDERLVKWFEDAGALPHADAAALLLSQQVLASER